MFVSVLFRSRFFELLAFHTVSIPYALFFWIFVDVVCVAVTKLYLLSDGSK